MASNIQLINCTNVSVTNDVQNFTGIGLSNITIDSSYNNTILRGDESSVTITSNSTLDRTYNNKIIYVDATGGNITITWDLDKMDDCKLTIIRKDGSVNTVSIDSVSHPGTENYIGNALPFTLTFTQYTAIRLTQKGQTIYNA